MYGMGAKLLSSILNTSIDECKQILDEFYKMFPGVKEFTKKNEADAKNKGYVEDYMGRRRHLPDAQLPDVTINAFKDVYTNADVFLDIASQDTKIKVLDKDKTKQWENIYDESYKGKGFDSKVKFKELAKESGIDVLDNGAFISKTLTQCTNARIQGSASSLTKKAMVLINNDEKLNKLGFKLLIPVHDELLGECPAINAEIVSERLAELMISAAKPECSVDMKVDTYVTKHWYADEVMNSIQNDYLKKIKTTEANQVIKDLCAEHSELSEDTIKQMCEGTFDLVNGELK